MLALNVRNPMESISHSRPFAFQEYFNKIPLKKTNKIGQIYYFSNIFHENIYFAPLPKRESEFVR